VTRVGIGIVSWNTAELLDACLAALPEACAGLETAICVVDNASVDQSALVAERHGVRLIVNEQNVGYARAMNTALTEARRRIDATVLIALNPDTVAPRESLSTLVADLLSQPDVGVVVPRLLNLDRSVQHSVYRFPSPRVSAAASFLPLRWQRGWAGRRWGLEAAADPPSTGDIDWGIGAVHVIRVAALDDEPVYDERWFMYAEDLDLCWRLAQRHWRLRLRSDVEVIHVGNAAGSQAWGAARTTRWLESTYDWYRVRHGRRAAQRWAAVNCLGTMFRLVPAEVGKRLGRPMEEWEVQLRISLPVHVQAVLHG
jgi:N-acetylglucosaminyl-diphospho-decaprenol L-rhamnosyltransferase